MSVTSAATTPPRRFWHAWLRFPADLWWRSLPLRVIASVFVASVLVLVLGGFLLMQQASSGVIKGKEQVASDEARQAVNNAQQIGGDGPGQRIRMALDEGVVGLVDRAVPEGVLQHGVGVLGLRDHHDAGGADVEALDDALPLARAAGRDAEARACEVTHHGGSVPAG